jgi:chromosome segregation protein
VIRIDGEIANLSQEDKSLRRVLTEAEMGYYEAEAKKKVLNGRIDELHAQEVALRSEIAQIAAKVDFLKGLIESGEGLSEGVRFLSSSDQWTASRHLTVADAVVAEERFRAAIESALGESTGFIIVDSAEDTERGIALLKQERQGKATFVCLDRVPRIAARLNIPKMPGIVGWATDLVEIDAAHTQLFQFLLDRTLIVEGRPIAAEAVEKIAGIRCVTLDGEIETGVGITRGGSMRKDEGGIIGKKAQIEGFQQEISLLNEQLASLRFSQEELIREHDDIQLKSFGEAVKNIEKEMSGVEMHIAQLEFEKRHARDIITKNIQEIETLSSSVKDLLAEIEAGTPYLEKLKNEKAEVERSMEADSVDLNLLETEWNTRSKAVNDLGIKIVAQHGEYQNVQSDLKRAQSAVDDASAMLARRESDAQSALTDIGLAEVGMQENAVELGKLNEELNTLQAQRSAIEDESTHIREEIHRIELRIKDARRHHDDSLQAVHDLELKIADLTAKSDHIKARALEEYEISLQLKTYPDDEFVDFATLREEIQALRERLKSLGNINFAAYEEYTTEKERFEFLTAQRKDLLEAEKTLISTIEEINSTAQRKFLETFALIRTNFIETFKSLFDPGDECDLRLEDGVDPLEGQIEIIAKPRGKRPTSIDLLSGGEKTLTATALLFAIYLVKPSPFCILDEVDAPLDDANIDRFTRILSKFSNNTQFIVVTHNKRTMEAANALYGVTMEEEGVSKLVTVRFNQGSEVRSAALVSG